MVFDEAFSFLVKLWPYFTKLAQCLLAYLKSFFILWSIETFQDNGDKKIQKDERNNDHEADEVGIGNGFISAFHSSMFFHAIVILGFEAIEDYTFLSSAVVHKLVPGFSRSHSEKGDDGSPEVCEVRMDVNSAILLNSRENGDS